MSGLFGGGGSDPNAGAMAAQKAQMKRLDALELPELKKYVLENPELVGLLEAEGIDPSKMEAIKSDPQFKENQMKALQGLSERAEQGITAEDKYAMEQMLGDVSSREQATQAAIEQDMARRGMDSSGAALMAKLQSKQSGANTARQQAMQMAAQGQQNKMNALAQLGAQSGQMASQDFNRQAQVASAQDAIARANAMNRQNVSGQNLAARQGIENQRANIANMNMQVDNQLAQQDFQNRYSKTGAQGSVANSMSQISANAPQKPGGLQSAMGGAATGASIGGSVGGPVGAGWGAAIGGGVGLLSSFEDGGVAGSYEDGGRVASRERDTIAQQNKDHSTKQHEKFKKNYMKRVHAELEADDQTKTPKAQDGLLFNQPSFAPVSATDNVDSTLQRPEMLQPVPVAADPVAAAVENTQLAPQEELLPKESEGMSGSQMASGLGALSKLLGDGGEKKAPLELTAYSQPELKNLLGSLQVPQFEDGGYASDGMGGVIDSGAESYADDRVDAKVNDGEMVVNLPQQQRLMDLIRGEISVDELGTDDIIEGVPREDRDEMHEKADQESKMKELLKMLGGL